MCVAVSFVGGRHKSGAGHVRADAIDLLHEEIKQPARSQRARAQDRGELLHVALPQEAAVEKVQDG